MQIDRYLEAINFRDFFQYFSYIDGKIPNCTELFRLVLFS
ncbi:hypothetical protein BMETH_1099_1 [methanotrophic bacterial endosymbiont of Bathymodiolus sp.]|nr:hypothetical protein BMETH_1099_1 [methanotrophic bacterial endosymbiont of Bathymodiolus sp.]